MSLATISIVGNLATTPEQHQFESGKTKVTFTVAVNSFNKVRKEKTTDYYRIETWDRLAELANSYLHKGNQVALSGRLAMAKWVDREGKDRVTPTVQANQLAFLPRNRPQEKDVREVARAPLPDDVAKAVSSMEIGRIGSVEATSISISTATNTVKEPFSTESEESEEPGSEEEDLEVQVEDSDEDSEVLCSETEFQP